MRVFIAPKTGTGTHADPWRPGVPIDATLNQLICPPLGSLARFLTWDVVDPVSGLTLDFYVVLANDPCDSDALNHATLGWELTHGCADLGDPADPQSLRQTKLGDAATDEIADTLGIPQARLKNMSGSQVLKYVVPELQLVGNRFRGGDPIDLFDETD